MLHKEFSFLPLTLSLSPQGERGIKEGTFGNCAPQRLGLFGGTFNPIHYGHLRSAEEVCEALGLTRLWFIPAGTPPHKADQGITPFAVRLEMTRLAVGDHPVMSVSDLEGRRPGRSYSIETLRQIRQEIGPSWELYFILGLDAVLEIATWKDYQDLFTLSHFVVLDRPGYDRHLLEEVLLTEVHPHFRPLAGGAGFSASCRPQGGVPGNHPVGYFGHRHQESGAPGTFGALPLAGGGAKIYT